MNDGVDSNIIHTFLWVGSGTHSTGSGKDWAGLIKKNLIVTSHTTSVFKFIQNQNLSLTLTIVLFLPNPNHTKNSRLKFKSAVCQS